MLLQLDQISDESVAELTPSFGDLPETEHLDGKYRLRRYSVVQCSGINPLAAGYMWDVARIHLHRHASCIELGDNTFTQSDEYNKFQGNIARKFEPIQQQVINSKGMLEMCCMFKNICSLPEIQKINVHQMRIITLDDETPVSPEGVHQDGYDYICVVGISRYNVSGGDFLAYMDQDKDPFMTLSLNPGKIVVIDDRILWHNATGIKPVIGKDGYMDAFILTARRTA